jgi:CheY-like chemotaxis protein
MKSTTTTTTKDLLYQLNDPSLSIDERALLRCRVAKELEEVGNYDAAQKVLGELWSNIGERPKIENLNQQSAAEVLLRVGTLTGWIGSTHQVEGSQEIAKDLMTESISIFESLGDLKKIAEAQTEIGYCYWREGAIDEALVITKQALTKLDDEDGDLKGIAVVRKALFEKIQNRLNEALNTLENGASVFEASTNHTLKGRFHNERANLLRRLGEIESRNDYLDRAVIEYTAASFHFEEARHARYQACVENNLALLYLNTDRLADAHEHLDRAQTLFTTLNDIVHLAQVAETRARVMLSEGAFVQAEKSARRAVQLLEKGDERSLLAEALTTHGITFSQLQRKDQARAAFERAIQVAEQAGDFEGAGLAALALAEELPGCLSDDELFTILEHADERLESTQNAALLRRQKNCFRRFASRLFWPDLPLSLENSVQRHEARLILRALEETGGVIKRAAGMLELSRQRLGKILNNRHKELRATIAEIKAHKRERSSNEDLTASQDPNRGREVHTISILHVEDDHVVAAMAKDMLEDNEGWQVETCANGMAALKRISSEAQYDLLLLDYDLPGVNGLEIVRRARNLARRSRTPIIVLSASAVGAEAREAGADLFLHKPQDVSSLVETIERLLCERQQEHERI